MRCLRCGVLALALACLSFVPKSYAQSFDTLDLLTQDNFRTLAENLSAATHYRGITPTEPLGIIGFDVGLSLSATSIDDEILDLANGGDIGTSRIFLPRLHVHKGLPFGIDIGAFIAADPDTDISLLGAEIRKAIFEGTALTPAVGVRLGFSTLEGLDDLSLQSTSIDISISKGVLMFTPYAGVGYVFTNAEADGEFDLDDEDFGEEKYYVGLNVNLGINFTIEADRTGDYNTIGAKAGIRF